jgi:hypothetical protein
MKILYLCSFGIGNAIAKTPAWRALKNRGHKIACLYDAGPLGTDYESLFEGSPLIDRWKKFDRTAEINGDTIVKWVTDFDPNIVVQAYAGDELWDWLYDYIPDNVDVRRAAFISDWTQNESEYCLDQIKDLIDDDYSVLYDVPHHTPDSSNMVDAWLNNYRTPIVSLLPCFKENWQIKHWGNENYGMLATLLFGMGYQPVLLDGESGIGRCNLISYLAPSCINLSGITTIQETSYIIRRSTFVVGNDCGPIKIAAAYKKPLMALWGPTDLKKNMPLSPNTFVLKTQVEHDCRAQSDSLGCNCLTILDPTLVTKAIREQIEPLINSFVSI